MLAGTAPSTNATYGHRQRTFSDFCTKSGAQALPASEPTLLAFITELNATGVKAETVSGYLSAIRHLHLINGFGDPLVGRERLTLIKRGISKQASPTALRAAVTNTHIQAFIDLIDLAVYNDAVFFAMCCCGFLGFLRISEMTHPDSGFSPDTCLTAADISWNDDGMIFLLRRSKTDRRNEGVRIVIGKNDSPVCAVKALQHYLNLRHSHWPFLDMSTSPLFTKLDGAPITKSVFSARLTELAGKVGVEGKVTPHSLRIGAATAAWRAGFSDSQIQSLGRWKSRAFMRYLRIDNETLAGLSTKLGAAMN